MTKAKPGQLRSWAAEGTAYVPHRLTALLILATDVITLAFVFAFSAWVARVTRVVLLPDLGGLPVHKVDAVLSRGIVFATIATVLLLWLASRGHYRQRHSFWFEFRDIALGCCLAALGDAFLQYAAKEDFSRLWLTIGWLLSLLLLPLSRAIVRRVLLALGIWQVPVVLIGDAARRRDIIDAFEADQALGYRVVRSEPFDFFAQDRSAAGVIAALNALEAENPHGGLRYILAPTHEEIPMVEEIVEILERRHMGYAIAAPLSGIPLHGLDQQYFLGRNLLLLTAHNNLERPVNRAAKRLFDIAVCGILLLLLAPLGLLLALLVKLDGGPVFFGHSRIGFNGKTFRCWKFRSMVVDADRRLQEYLEKDPQARLEWEKDFKLRKDPRVTWLGNALRVSGLDELPQILNVLMGEMSLVGPRPIVSAEIARYGNSVSSYLSVRPGITGLWQVSGRNDVDYQTRVAFDHWYTRNWSLWLDFVILLKTVPAVLSRRGAY